MLRTLSLVLLSSSAFAGSLSTPIVGGTDVPPGRWPDVVAVIGDLGACSGTLIAADLVLTAGHCIGIEPKTVVINSIDWTRPGGESRAVKWARAYPEWQSHYDVGIVMLENPVAVPPRAVAQYCSRSLVADSRLQIVGFGLTTNAGTDANTRLHEASVPVVDATCTGNAACEPSVAPGGEFTAGGHGVDACFGDSGGPAFLDTKQGPALIGVVSRALADWTNPCGGGGVYVRADKVVAWIERVSGRKLLRAPCDRPGDDAGEGEAGGCSAGSGVEAIFTLLYGALCIGALRRARRRRIAG